MRDRIEQLLALRTAHDEYRALQARIQRLTQANPRGLEIRPLFGQAPRPAPRIRRAA